MKVLSNRGIGVGLVLLTAWACASGSAPTRAPAAASRPAERSTPPLPSRSASPPASVFVVVMENRSYATALADPTIAGLARRYEVATGYHAVAHPSLPNYLALTSGDTYGITDDAYHHLPAGGLGLQLTRAGLAWRAYFEGMDAGCFNSPAPYALKHNPFAYYGGACPEQVVSLAPLAADLRLPPGRAPRLYWITPGLCHDGHDCATATAASFLGGLVDQITAAPAWQAGGVLFVVWDEDDGGSANHVPLLVITPGRAGAVGDHAYDHYSLLAAIEDRLGLPRLGRAAGADPLSELLV
jgi:hypothetical protein